MYFFCIVLNPSNHISQLPSLCYPTPSSNRSVNLSPFPQLVAFLSISVFLFPFNFPLPPTPVFTPPPSILSLHPLLRQHCLISPSPPNFIPPYLTSASFFLPLWLCPFSLFFDCSSYFSVQLTCPLLPPSIHPSVCLSLLCRVSTTPSFSPPFLLSILSRFLTPSFCPRFVSPFCYRVPTSTFLCFFCCFFSLFSGLTRRT